MIIHHISDTHLQEFETISSDILIHSGDCLNSGSFDELIKFRTQLEKVKDKHELIILCPGNHDWAFEPKTFNQARDFLQETIPNLKVEYHGGFKYKEYNFFCSSWQPFFCNWNFNVKDNLDLLELYEQIPKDVDILITHCPAKGILDYVPRGGNVGSKALQRVLPELKQLKAHFYGHIHYSAGLQSINGIYYSNGAICNENYKAVNKGNIIELS